MKPIELNSVEIGNCDLGFMTFNSLVEQDNCLLFTWSEQVHKP